MRTLALMAVMMSACATVPRPLSASRVAQVRTPEAVVTHLTQAQASGEVCDARLSADLLAEAGLQRAIIDAWVDGRISAAVFGRCLELALETLEPSVSREFLDTLVPLYEGLLSDGELERSQSKQDSLRALHVAMLERPIGVEASKTVVSARIQRLRGLLGELGPVRKQFAAEVLEVDDLEADRWLGTPMTPSVLGALEAAGNERVLLRAALRLPTEPLRREAARRLVRLRIATSPFPELSPTRQKVEEAVLRDGTNPIDLEHAHIDTAWLARDPSWTSGLEIAQPRGAGFHSLQSSSGILPMVTLRGVVWAKVEGFSQALTVCREGRPLDPTPCLPEAALSIPSPLVRSIGRGRYEFIDDLERSQSVEFAGADLLRLPVHLDGEVMGWLTWTMRYLPGPSIEYEARNPGGTGPTTKVRARELFLSKRVVFEVESEGSRDLRVVEENDLGQFQIISRGGQGESGFSGADGAAGVDGAECSDGSAGGAGSGGGPGGPGGPGGMLFVAVQCIDTPCSEESLTRLQRAILSRGGEGGPGGAGGSGGRGGAGGSARPATSHVDNSGQTVTDHQGCSSGSDGPRGPDGSRGPDGPAGSPGSVFFQDMGGGLRL